MNFEEPIAVGNTAKIYLQDGKIVKVFHGHLPDSEAEYEANKQKLVHAYGLPVPNIYEVIEINGKRAIVMEHIKGKPVGSLLFADMSKAELYMDLSVDIQLKIHAVKAPGMELMSDKLRRQITAAHQLNDKQKEALLERLDAIKYDHYLCHGDYHVFNLILHENQVTIIDWVDASSGDLRADVYRTYLLYKQFSADLADLYLRLYCDKSGIRQNEILVWAPIIAGARLSEHVTSEKASRLLEIVNESI